MKSKSIFSLPCSYLNDFIELIFPNNCVVCGKALLFQEVYLCTNCLYHLPRTSFHKEKDNAVSKLMWGRVYIEHASSFFFYRKGSEYQQILYQLKYNGQKELGYEMGKHYGADLKTAESFPDVDLLIPVPLHPARERSRGYNQSYWIAKGLSEMIEKPVVTNAVKRVINTKSQTKKTRGERWENVQSIFELQNNKALENKHVLIVDDVITTGATIEALANTLLQTENVKISLATLAVAQR